MLYSKNEFINNCLKQRNSSESEDKRRTMSPNDDNESTNSSYSHTTSNSEECLNKPNTTNTTNDNSFFIDDEDNELNMNEASLFLAKFLLKIVETCFTHLDKTLRFNANMFFASSNLTSSSSSAFLHDAQTNSMRDLNYTQHLLANILIHILYILNCGNYPNMCNAFCLLLNESTASASSRKEATTTATTTAAEGNETDQMNQMNEQFNFDSRKFTLKLNKIILFKISKSNPLLATLWQQFLVLCNYQDPEYWLLSLESTHKKANQHHHHQNQHQNLNFDQQNDSSCSSTNNSLTADTAVAITASEETSSIASAKMLRSKIRSLSNYAKTTTTTTINASNLHGSNKNAGLLRFITNPPKQNSPNIPKIIFS